MPPVKMARSQSPRFPHLGDGRPMSTRFRPKEYMFALLAGIVVVAFIFYSREGNDLRAPKPHAGALQNEIPVVPPPSKGAVAPAPAYTPAQDYDEEALDMFSPGHASVPAPSNSNGNSNGKSKGESKGESSWDSKGDSSWDSKGDSGWDNKWDSKEDSNSVDVESGSAGGGSKSGSSGSSGSSTHPSAALDTSHATDRPIAVIIESSIIPNLVPLMLHFSTVLGPSWGLVLFTLQDRWVEPLSPAFQRLLASGQIEVRSLPADAQLTSSAAVSRFLTQPWIWEQLSAAKRVLLFQTDSVLCSKSEAAVEDYFKFDFVGAPIASQYGAGYNGGLSIRNPKLFLQITRETDFASSGHEFEDQFFYQELVKRGAEMPEEGEAKTFAVETIFYETPLGYHQPQRWQAEHMSAIEEWCPEVKLLIGRRAQ